VSQAIVIGGGVGGLAAAIHLARGGMKTRILERAPTLGGKLREVTVAGRAFLAGPSVFTMKWVFEELFAGKLADYLQLEPIDPFCRHFFADGSHLDLFTDEQRSREAIERFSGPADARGYLAFRKNAAKIFEIVRGPFMENPIPPLFEFLSPRALLQFTQIDGLRTLQKAIEEHFRDARLRQLFGRYATYNGSSPYHAPATLAVIAHVENAYGIFAPKGGIVRLASAMEQLARELGVEIETGVEIERIVVENDRAVGVQRRGGGVERAPVMVANCDVAQLYEQLLPPTRPLRKTAEKYAAEELSLSAYVLLAVAKPPPFEVLHHNVFFSRDYKREFDELIVQRRPPDDPTVYLCREDHERCFFLTNAPPLDARGGRIDWATEAPRCRDRIAGVLRRHNWTLETEAEQSIDPREHADRFPRSRGALYGLASNSRMAAFKRPPNQVMPGLYCAGGTVHPGAGLPMVCLSARIASKLAIEELRGGA
jgi:1-hydroxycarotenoid 3,4-desaturase